jgi:transcriptional regulator with XRE-family HTH domain
MSREVVFSLYLQERMKVAGLDVPTLARKMNYRTIYTVRAWFEGRRLPSGYQLHELAMVLGADPVVLSSAWLIAVCAELEDVLRQEILVRRKETVPDV